MQQEGSQSIGNTQLKEIQRALGGITGGDRAEAINQLKAGAFGLYEQQADRFDFGQIYREFANKARDEQIRMPWTLENKISNYGQQDVDILDVMKQNTESLKGIFDNNTIKDLMALKKTITNDYFKQKSGYKWSQPQSIDANPYTVPISGGNHLQQFECTCYQDKTNQQASFKLTAYMNIGGDDVFLYQGKEKTFTNNIKFRYNESLLWPRGKLISENPTVPVIILLTFNNVDLAKSNYKYSITNKTSDVYKNWVKSSFMIASIKGKIGAYTDGIIKRKFQQTKRVKNALSNLLDNKWSNNYQGLQVLYELYDNDRVAFETVVNQEPRNRQQQEIPFGRQGAEIGQRQRQGRPGQRREEEQYESSTMKKRQDEPKERSREREQKQESVIRRTKPGV